MSQEATANEIREEHEEARRELYRPQQPVRWQATTEVETLTEQPEGPTLQCATRTQEKLTQNLADVVTATKQGFGSNWLGVADPLQVVGDTADTATDKINTVRDVA